MTAPESNHYPKRRVDTPPAVAKPAVPPVIPTLTEPITPPSQETIITRIDKAAVPQAPASLEPTARRVNLSVQHQPTPDTAADPAASPTTVEGTLSPVTADVERATQVDDATVVTQPAPDEADVAIAQAMAATSSDLPKKRAI